jgi:hypothetical protein
MLAYQNISQHFDSSDIRLKRSMSPDKMNQYHRESTDYVRHIRRRSLSRSISPVRSHSPSYVKTKTAEHNHLIKRSVSEEDLRMNHERRRLSMDDREHQITHRPQILMSYHRGLKVESDEEVEKIAVNKTWLSAEEQDEDAPLDLSMGSKKRRDRVDSGTDSDDSTGLGDEGEGGRGNEGRAYKKSLMKRYCKFFILPKPKNF